MKQWSSVHRNVITVQKANRGQVAWSREIPWFPEKVINSECERRGESAGYGSSRSEGGGPGAGWRSPARSIRGAPRRPHSPRVARPVRPSAVRRLVRSATAHAQIRAQHIRHGGTTTFYFALRLFQYDRYSIIYFWCQFHVQIKLIKRSFILICSL